MTGVPLYASARTEGVSPQDGHAGLWYDKFFDEIDLRSGMIIKPTNEDRLRGKWSWISRLNNEKIGDGGMIVNFLDRRESFVENCGGGSLTMALTSSFVSGLGYDHAVENGFLWHHTLGVPYLPGSSVKGLVRAWADIMQGEVDTLFGVDRAGAVVFLDAIPVAPVTLGIEVMTPHDGGWRLEPEGAPSDWISPVPNPYLVVKVPASFVFSVLPRRHEDIFVCKQALDILCEALGWQGAGAKTNIGFGRFENVEATGGVALERLAEYERQPVIWAPEVGADVYYEMAGENVKVMAINGDGVTIKYLYDDGIDVVPVSALRKP